MNHIKLLETYNALKEIPFVTKLIHKNNKLKMENKAFFCLLNKQFKSKKNSLYKFKNIDIKKEKLNVSNNDNVNINEIDSDIEILENKNENIVYEIFEEDYSTHTDNPLVEDVDENIKCDACCCMVNCLI